VRHTNESWFISERVHIFTLRFCRITYVERQNVNELAKMP